MPTLAEYRREHLRKLITQYGGAGAFAKRVNSASSTIVQMSRPSPIREVTAEKARELEGLLGLDVGYMDEPIDVPPGQPTAAENRRAMGLRRQAKLASGGGVVDAEVVEVVESPASPVAQAALSEDQLTALVLLIGREADAAGVQLPSAKFAQIIRLALADARSHNGMPDVEHIKSLLELVK